MFLYFRLSLYIFFLISVFFLALPVSRSLYYVYRARAAGRFRCLRCGSCCTLQRLKLTLKPGDIKRLSDSGHSGFAEEDLSMKKINGRCMFLKKSGGVWGCSVNDIKPDACRSWPFRTFRVLGRDIRYVKTRFDCPALKTVS